MKVGDPKGASTSGLGGLERVNPASKGPTGVPERTSSGTDQIHLSSFSAYLASAPSDSPVHVANLSALAGAVLSGRYFVDANLVSASIIQHGLQFGGANYL